MKMHFATKGTRISAGDAAIGGVTAQRRNRRCSLIAGFALSCCVALQVSNAQLTILHSFGDGTVPNDGADVLAGLIQAPDGNFYGGTVLGAGKNGHDGTVFRMTPAGVLTVLHFFIGGADVRSALLFYNGELLGASGGAGGTGGFVFSTKLSGKTTKWHIFTQQDGLGPNGLILGSDGFLYGTTTFGGSNVVGIIFKLNPVSPYALTVLHNFTGTGTDGAVPKSALLLAKDGNYYGTTWRAGAANGGTIFKMTPDGQVTTVYEFPQDGFGPDSPLIQASDGNFYGTTEALGKYKGGTVFKMTPNFRVKVLHAFGNGTDGSLANGLVQGPNGNLYGTTVNGGTGRGGTIFEISIDGSSYTVLHNFSDGSVTNDGFTPWAPLTVGSDNNLYGTTQAGGSANKGTVFRISP